MTGQAYLPDTGDLIRADFDPTSIDKFQTWLLNGNATNMANMLSVQLSATALNVREAALLVQKGFIPAGGELTVNTVVLLQPAISLESFAFLVKGKNLEFSLQDQREEEGSE